MALVASPKGRCARWEKLSRSDIPSSRSDPAGVKVQISTRHPTLTYIMRTTLMTCAPILGYCAALYPLPVSGLAQGKLQLSYARLLIKLLQSIAIMAIMSDTAKVKRYDWRLVASLPICMDGTVLHSSPVLRRSQHVPDVGRLLGLQR